MSAHKAALNSGRELAEDFASQHNQGVDPSDPRKHLARTGSTLSIDLETKTHDDGELIGVATWGSQILQDLTANKGLPSTRVW